MRELCVPLIVSAARPGPWIVTSPLSKRISPDVKPIVVPAGSANRILCWPGSAMASCAAWRSVPAPLSTSRVTRKTFACAGALMPSASMIAEASVAAPVPAELLSVLARPMT